jgi:hypothetical protein
MSMKFFVLYFFSYLFLTTLYLLYFAQTIYFALYSHIVVTLVKRQSLAIKVQNKMINLFFFEINFLKNKINKLKLEEVNKHNWVLA